MKSSPPPLPSSRRKSISPAAARTAALANQLATPGLGSLLARRWIAGVGQLLLAVSGFGFVVWWFIAVLIRYYRLMWDSAQTPARPVAWIGLTGAALFIASWFWALVTSVSILRQARHEEQSAALAELQRPL